MRARSKELLERAIAAMLAAIEVYNKPDFRYRAESFVILAANAWELLLKAKWLSAHRNRLSSLYVRQGVGARRKRIKKTKAGNPITHSLMYLAHALEQEGKLHRSVVGNLDVLNELRDSAIHFYHPDPQFAAKLQEVAVATVKNFNLAAGDWFGEDLSRFNFFLLPLSFVEVPPATEAVPGRRAVQRLMKFLSERQLQATEDGSPYAVALNVELRLVKSKSLDAAPVRVTDDPSAPAVRLTEEQVRERYPWDYRTLTGRCRERYGNFKVDRKYHDLRRKCETDSCYAYVRRLDPGNPRSPAKRFYNPNILQELDKHYMRKAETTQ